MPERRRKRTNQDRGTDEVKQDRSLLLYVLLSFVTFSVYHFYFMDLWAKDVNILCEKDILTPMVIPTQCLVAATGALPVSVTSSMESAICSLHSICKF